MKDCFCDMHIHIGATSEGKPVKITASRKLIFESIVKESLSRKGMDMIGIVDCASPGVLRDIRSMIRRGELYQLSDGGLLHRERLTVIPASEVETAEKNGGTSHHIAYFPTVGAISEFSNIMRKHITNIELSSQRASLTASELFNVVQATGGVFIPAHVFTPHKSLYGNAGRRLSGIFGEKAEDIIAIELGLSADTDIADHLEELRNITFLSNSDAHSIPKIAREYNVIRMEKPGFREFILALHRRGGRKVVKNVGMDPFLGRYHRTFCLKCDRVQEGTPPVLKCEYCGAKGKDIVRGVIDRIIDIGDYDKPRHPAHRPPYSYQIPLMFVPGITDRVLKYLLSKFGTEMAILNTVSEKDIKSALPVEIARNLIDARNGKLKMKPGGGGHHGKVKKRDKQYIQLSLDL
ncbi:MAG: endonuclease Q family protein [Candidatus Eremiobacteraeota bacterium]|nr:endonuclease Q family protein [Candidatus Eremiobacteraeota bacterium]